MAGPASRSVDVFANVEPFAGFGYDDFDAYDPKKWRSKVYTPERRSAKARLLALVQRVRVELGEELKGLELQASDEAPTLENGRSVEAQWVFFLRDAESRAALKPLLQTTDLASAGLFDIAVRHQHACVAFRVDFHGLTMSVELAGKARVDRENLAGKLKERWAREKLLEIAGGLPDGARLGVAEQMASARTATGESVDAWSKAIVATDTTFIAEMSVSKDDPTGSIHEGRFAEEISQHAGSFLRLYHFLAWSRDNDHTQIKDALKKSADERQKKAAAFQPGDRVTILSGLFAGRAGYFSELDNKGRAKVMVGPIAVTVESKDLKPA